MADAWPRTKRATSQHLGVLGSFLHCFPGSRCLIHQYLYQFCLCPPWSPQECGLVREYGHLVPLPTLLNGTPPWHCYLEGRWNGAEWSLSPSTPLQLFPPCISDRWGSRVPSAVSGLQEEFGCQLTPVHPCIGGLYHCKPAPPAGFQQQGSRRKLLRPSCGPS